jgi:hypothetical protein
MHIMDIVENGLSAGADLIDISVVEDSRENWLRITIVDNGCGIPSEKLDVVVDPFYTTHPTRRVGLGLPLWREASRRCDGEFSIESEENKGTRVYTSFRLNHIDLPPWGDMAGALTGLIVGNPEADFIYAHSVDGEVFRLATDQIKQELDGLPLDHPEVIAYLTGAIRDSLAELKVARGVGPS